MKTHKNKTTYYNVVFMITSIVMAFANGCQKSSDRKSETVKNEIANNGDKTAEKTVPTNLCSSEIMNLGNSYFIKQKKSNSVYEKMTTQNEPGLRKNYQKLATEQFRSCYALINQMEKEKINSCLKSTTEKTVENSVFKTDVSTIPPRTL